MRTDDLIAVLATQPGADAAAAGRRFLARLAPGPVVALLLMLVLLGPRPDLEAAMALPMFWMKLALPASVAIAAWLLLWRLGLPGVRLGRGPVAVATPLAIAWLAGALVLWNAPASERLGLVLGQTWLQCPVSITLLAVPALGFSLWALRGMAPTRLPLAGAAAGLFAGAAAAFAYAFHCPELQAPFLAVWYVLGMLVPAALGALLGRRLLHW